MTFNFPKTLLVLLLCLTFIGQALSATVMSYHMISMGSSLGNSMTQSSVEPSSHSSHSSSQTLTNGDHSGHHMMNDANSNPDCCDKNCDCLTSGCASVAVLIKHLANEPVMDFSAKISSFSSLAASQRLTSLYRPPILS